MSKKNDSNNKTKLRTLEGDAFQTHVIYYLCRDQYRAGLAIGIVLSRSRKTKQSSSSRILCINT